MVDRGRRGGRRTYGELSFACLCYGLRQESPWIGSGPWLGLFAIIDKRLHRSVPISKLPQLIQETQDDIKRSGLKSIIVGHAGDGRHSLSMYVYEGNSEP